jgi:5'(3')-deoxyribonucleotidase
MKVVLDVDGPLTDFHAKARGVILAEFGYDFPISNYREWDVTSVLPTQAEKDRMNDLIAMPGWASSMIPDPAAMAAVSRMRDLGADILFATAPHPESKTWKEEREAWLIEHFGAHHLEIAFIHRKDFLGGKVFVDDKPSNVRGWNQSNGSGSGFLWKTFYNEAERGLEFLESWEVVLKMTEFWAHKRLT